VTYGTIRQFHWRLYLVLFGQFLTGLLPLANRTGHDEDLIARAQEPGGLPMTVQAPFHVKGLIPPHQLHLVHLPMARDAADTFVNMDAVIEIDKIRKIVNSCPRDRPVFPIAAPDRFQRWTIRPDLRVTIHAGLGGRDSGEGRVFDRRMTVSTIDSQSGDVVLVAEWNRLVAHDADLGHIGRA
jgi:hypothetical protein